MGQATRQGETRDDRIARVVLHKHGMGYFERRARVAGDCELRLSFRHDEMDDVLKSLAFADAGGGTLASVSYDPHPLLAQRVDDIRIALPESGGLVALLGRIRGAEVLVRTAGDELQGRVLGVERMEEARGDVVVEVEMLSLAVGDSFRRVRVPEILELRPLDAALCRDLARLLERSDASRRSERRQLSLHLRGEGDREVSVAYTVPTTVWKSTYRIVFEDETRPRLIGFAVVDNDGPEAWEDVQLSLVSGLPVSFTHDLYAPRRRERPHVRVKSEAPVAPPVLEAAFSLDDSTPSPTAAAGAGAADDLGGDFDELSLDDSMDGGEVCAGEAGTGELQTPLLGAMQESVDVSTHGSEQGDLFRYDIETPVTIPSGSSALVPILSEEMEGEIVCVYNADVRRNNPLSSFRLTNTSDLTLEGGPATVLRAGEYAGEAMLETLSPNQEVLLPFSVELGCRITTAFDSKSRVAESVRIAAGKLHHVSFSQRITHYTIRNTTQRELCLWIEHPANRQAQLVDTPEPIERTEHFDRFRLSVPADSQVSFPVTERVEVVSTQILSHVSFGQHIALVKSIGNATDARDALETLTPVMDQIAAAEKERREIDDEVKKIAAQHVRIRKNLSELGSETQKERDLRERYIESLDRDETRLEQMGTRREELQDSLTEQGRQFIELARELEVTGSGDPRPTE